MARRVNNQKSRNFEINRLAVMNQGQVFLKILLREVSCTDLLCDTASFTCLHIGLPQLVQNQSFARVYVPHHTDDRAPKLLLQILPSSLGRQLLFPLS
jgi:hypothetical protein